MIVKKVLGQDENYGLPIELRIISVLIDGENKNIKINYKVVVVSPTGIEIKIIEQGEYMRYNTLENPKYTELENSVIGQGIKQMLNMDLEIYPNFRQD